MKKDVGSVLAARARGSWEPADLLAWADWLEESGRAREAAAARRDAAVAGAARAAVAHYRPGVTESGREYAADSVVEAYGLRLPAEVRAWLAVRRGVPTLAVYADVVVGKRAASACGKRTAYELAVPYLRTVTPWLGGAHAARQACGFLLVIGRDRNGKLAGAMAMPGVTVEAAAA